MKSIYKLIGLLCILALVTSCQCNLFKKGDKKCPGMEISEKCPHAQKACPLHGTKECPKSEGKKCPKDKGDNEYPKPCCKKADKHKKCPKTGEVKTCQKAEKKCAHKSPDGKPCSKCASWNDPEKINPYCGKVGNFLDRDIEALRKTARDAYNAKDYEKAAKYYIAYIRHNVKDDMNIYNLACCYGLLGKAELAAKYLERAYKTGLGDLNWIKGDSDFDKVRESEVFSATVAKLEEEMKRRKSEHGELAYIKSESFIRSYINLPEDFDEGKNYSLLLGLHGYGSSPEGFTGLWKKFENPGFIYVALQAPYPFIGSSGYSWGPFTEDEEMREEPRRMTAKYVAGAIDYLKSKYDIGDIYLLGHSQGGNAAYKNGILNHELLKGIISFGAPFDPEWFEKHSAALQAAKTLRVFIAHGNEDQVVPEEDSQKAKEMFLNAGYPVLFSSFEGGHNVPEEVLNKVQKWMKGEELSN